MGVEYWLIDKTNEIKIYCGKLGGKDIFLTNCKLIEETIDKITYDLSEIKEKERYQDIKIPETKLCNMNLQQTEHILKYREMAHDMYFPDRNPFPFIYYIYEIKTHNLEWAYVSEYDVEQYEDYLVLNDWFKYDKKGGVDNGR